MKIAFLSDIHGNEVALRAVMEDIERLNCEQTYVLGDICYRGASPKECLRIVQNAADGVLKGNADEWVVRGVLSGEVPGEKLAMMQREQAWTRSQLSDADVRYLDDLPLTLTGEIDTVRWFACHATAEDLFHVIPPDAADERVIEHLIPDNTLHLVLYGHIHLPYVRTIGNTTVVNLGSVGLPFDGVPQASYVVVDITAGQLTVNLRRVAYDIDSAIRCLRINEYPNVDYVARVLQQARP